MGDYRVSENRKTTSIARRINISFWFKRLFAILGFDLAIFVCLLGVFGELCVRRLPEGIRVPRDIQDVELEGRHYGDLSLVLEIKESRVDVLNARLTDEPEQEMEIVEPEVVVVEPELVQVVYAFPVSDFFDYAQGPAIVLAALEGLYLFTSFFGTGAIRRKLRPLNNLAYQAEQLSNLPLDSTRLDHLEQAILKVSPDEQNARIKTGDDDLRSIEIALNNLLSRMRESQRQQARFVSDASHELRTPISVIQGYVNMLDRWGKEDENVLTESIEALKNESEHMKELVEQLLFLARGDSGRNVLKPVELDLLDVVSEVWEESIMIDEKHRYEFSQARSEVDEEGPQETFLMEGDLAMVKQSLRIFVQNAAKYTEEGGTISFSVKKTADSVSYVVQDEGIGMGEEDVVHIFERFYRSDEARNGQTGGSGLGLSIAKWIVDAHQGTIDVLSRPEFGTRFTVTFPVKEL